MTRTSDLVETLAIAAAAACLAHCLALPLVIAALPAMASAMPVPESFHLLALVVAVPTTALALVAGYRHHAHGWPLLAGMGGLVLLAAGAISFGHTPWELPVTVLGSLVIAAAHLFNWRLRRA